MKRISELLTTCLDSFKSDGYKQMQLASVVHDVYFLKSSQWYVIVEPMQIVAFIIVEK